MANILFVAGSVHVYYAAYRMSKEAISLQFDMFSGELVDARTDTQKRKDRERSTPQQMQMFRSSEIVQFGGKMNSAYSEWLNQATAPPLVLQLQETRTPEEIELDLVREAQKQMCPLFGEEIQDTVDVVTKPDEDTTAPLPVVIFDAKTHLCQRGLRARLRAQSVPIRRRL